MYAAYDEMAEDTRMDNIEKVSDELGLAPEQKTALLEQQKQARSARETIRYQIRRKRKELKEEIEKSETDQAAIEQITQELKDLQDKLIDERVTSIMKVKEILTPEQFEKFQAGTQRRLYKTAGKETIQVIKQE